jgi:regulator of sirC expression with transglutaminase-like and TPR domain
MNFLRKLFRPEEPRVMELSPATTREIDTRLKKAIALRLSHQYELALVECNEILRLYPASHLAYQIRALAKYDLDDKDGAIRDWNHFKALRKRFNETGSAPSIT